MTIRTRLTVWYAAIFSVSLLVIVGLIGASVVASLAFPERKDGAEIAGDDSGRPPHG